MATCNDNIAMVAGVNAGIIAELLDNIFKNNLENVCSEYGKQLGVIQAYPTGWKKEM